ncbi:hypothetical protein BC832DRAFT_561956 [Gaertneriomyces semiglobifer]|nr:hypothetical protein BC832DRAFT_561956 [Gaertneriomyces semiglobifer]
MNLLIIQPPAVFFLCNVHHLLITVRLFLKTELKKYVFNLGQSTFVLMNTEKTSLGEHAPTRQCTSALIVRRINNK